MRDEADEIKARVRLQAFRIGCFGIFYLIKVFGPNGFGLKDSGLNGINRSELVMEVPLVYGWAGFRLCPGLGISRCWLCHVPKIFWPNVSLAWVGAFTMRAARLVRGRSGGGHKLGILGCSKPGGYRTGPGQCKLALH